MDFQDCIKFANENGACAIATVEGDQPRLRYVAMCHADDTGFCFQTESAKAFYKQMTKNPKVEVCFRKITPPTEGRADPTEKNVMRVSGEVEFVEDLALKAQILESRTFLKAAGIVKPDDPRLIVFRISKGEAFFWSLADTMKESEIPRIKFGGK